MAQLPGSEEGLRKKRAEFATLWPTDSPRFGLPTSWVVVVLRRKAQMSAREQPDTHAEGTEINHDVIIKHEIGLCGALFGAIALWDCGHTGW